MYHLNDQLLKCVIYVLHQYKSTLMNNTYLKMTHPTNDSTQNIDYHRLYIAEATFPSCKT